jgi:arylsulfate sulfotransferase
VKLHTSSLLCCLIVAVASPLMAQFTVMLTPNPSGPQPVGTTITWTANVSGNPDPNPSYLYTFSANVMGQPKLVRRGYGDTKTWTWTPNAFEGTFTIGVTVKDTNAGTQASTSTSYTLTPALVNGHAGIHTTNHPLVAFFSTKSCQVPNSMRVRFTPTSVPAGGNPAAQTTNLVACRFNTSSQTPDNTTMNFYIAGMYPNTTYNMHWETVNPAGTVLHVGTDYPFTTGAIDPSLFFPTFSSTGMTGNPQYGLVLYSIVTLPDHNGHIETSSAVDLAGNIVWYAAPQAGAPSVPPVRTETGGNYWGFVNPASKDPYLNGIRESDPAGNPILETTLGAINDGLAALGDPRPINSLHHEVRRLTTQTAGAPHGYIMVLANSQYTCTNCQGGTQQDPVDLIGDQVVVMDNNMNVVWYWDEFDWLDVNHMAILGEKCTNPAGGGGCEPFSSQFTFAYDWQHSNALQYEAYDGSIIVSSRHQDAVYKVNFNNGTGDGHIIWELGNPEEMGGLIGGPGGAPLPTFTLTTNGAGGPDLGYPWFSHQHDPAIALRGQLFNGSRLLTIFDDGNTRQAFFNKNANSRCQELSINETNLTANLNINGDEQGYSFALGTSQLLGNGTSSSISCDSGYVNMGQGPQPPTNTVETDANSNFIFSFNASSINYRSWRMQDLYTAINP